MKITFFLFSLLAPFFLFSQTVYVNAAASGNNSGTSWENAYVNLQDAVNNTVSGQIWIAEGVYRPTNINDRNSRFVLENGVEILGGFPPSGNPNIENRDWLNFETILDGDIGVQNDTSDNSYRILSVSYSDAQFRSTTTIDGITIRGANSIGQVGGSNSGALTAFSFLITNNNLHIKNCIFENNFANRSGAAFHISTINVLVDNCIFRNNTGVRLGAAIDYRSGSDNSTTNKLICNNSYFTSNYAGREGGAITTWGIAELNNCVFNNNSTGRDGGVFDHNGFGQLKAVNCNFITNTVPMRGSVLKISNGSGGQEIGASFFNCIFFENSGSDLVLGASLTQPEDIIVSYSLLPECLEEVFCDGGNIYSDNPLFQSTNNPVLVQESPCINSGLNGFVDPSISQDILGNSRIMQQTVDMGAYESDFTSSLNYISNIDLGLEIYPNPTSNFVKLKVPHHILPVDVTISDATGRKIRKFLLSKEEINLSLFSNFHAGIYMIQISNKTIVSNIKLVKN